MPARTKVNDAEVLALLSQGLTGRETARRMGIHELTVYAVAKRNKGICVQCSAPVTPPHTHCEKCRKVVAERTKRKRLEWRRAGLCVICQKPRCTLSVNFCEEHRIADINAGIQYRNRQKRGAPNQGIPNTAQRERAIREKYGDGAVAAWRRANGQCELCGVSYREKALHMHHIDEDYENRAEANFSCLCFSCHQLVHKFKDHANRKRVLAFVERHYPGG